MGVDRRKPLVLTSTRALIDSILGPSITNEGDFRGKPLYLHLRAGILRMPGDRTDISDPKLASLDNSALVGLSTSVLKKLSVTSGSLVLVKNVETNVQRIAQVVVLDPPSIREHSSDMNSPFSKFPNAMLAFPSYSLPPNETILADEEVAYISPVLAFNLQFHLSCLKSLVHQGKETLASLFDDKVDCESLTKGSEAAIIEIEVQPWVQLPKYASHLRVSFINIPKCGVLESLIRSSSIKADDRQEMIDLALHDYFEVDRYLAIGDLFSIHINWNCSSLICIPCSQRIQDMEDSIIYFKVVAMEPSAELVLRVNRAHTALVLGGNVPSALPPDLFTPGPKGFVPIHENTVKMLASILTPAICPSELSSKFRVAVLLCGLAGSGKRTVVRYVARRLGVHVVEVSCHDLMASSQRKTSVALVQAFKMAHRYSPTILLLRHFDVFRNSASHEGSPSDQAGIASEVASVIREFTVPVTEDEDVDIEEKPNGDCRIKEAESLSRHTVLLIAAAEGFEGLPPSIRRCFSHEIRMGPLTEEQRAEILSQSLQSVSQLLNNTNTEEFIKDVVGQSSGFMPRDIHALVADAGANLITRHQKVEPGDSDNSIEDKVKDNDSCKGPQIHGKDALAKALDRSKKRNASALGTPKVPNVKWEDVGGLEDVKKSILDTVQLPLLHKDLFSSGLRKRSGVLLYGPPGTGKTLLAKAVATECSLNFLSVKGPELINMYIGESEKNVRDIFQKARSARPCVIFFDELDSLAPARGASGDSGGVMDRVVSQMLAEIDGLNDSSQDLFIIGASNRPDLIDPALLRPGRFDKLLYVGVNSDASYRERVLKALTRKFKLHEDVSLYSIAMKCPPNFTGADMYALCADAWFHAAKRMVLSPASDSSSIPDQADSVVVEYEDFVKVLGELSPSLSIAELKKYELLRNQFEGASQ